MIADEARQFVDTKKGVNPRATWDGVKDYL